jgi:hypothetical protein
MIQSDPDPHRKRRIKIFTSVWCDAPNHLVEWILPLGLEVGEGGEWRSHLSHLLGEGPHLTLEGDHVGQDEPQGFSILQRKIVGCYC